MFSLPLPFSFDYSSTILLRLSSIPLPLPAGLPAPALQTDVLSAAMDERLQPSAVAYLIEFELKRRGLWELRNGINFRPVLSRSKPCQGAKAYEQRCYTTMSFESVASKVDQ